MIGKDWRPPDWEVIKIIIEHYAEQFGEGDHEKWLITDDTRDLIEAGADALLKALWKLAEESPTKTFTIDARGIHIYKAGKDDRHK